MGSASERVGGLDRGVGLGADRALQALEADGTDPWISELLGAHRQGPDGALHDWLGNLCHAHGLLG